MPKTKRKKKRYKTKRTPSQTPKTLKNLIENKENQQITHTHLDPVLLPKTSQNGTQKRTQKKPKCNTQKEPKKACVLTQFGHQKRLKMTPQNDFKTNQKRARTKNPKKSEKRAPTAQINPNKDQKPAQL